MRDISFRDVLHALDQQRTLHSEPVAAPPLSSPPAPPSPPPPAVLPVSPSTLAMALLASASLQLSAPLAAPRPIAIRPKNADVDSPTTSDAAFAPHPPALLEIPPLPLLPIAPPVERRPHVRAIAPRPSGTPPSSSSAMVDLASASSSRLYLSPPREPAELSDSSADIKLSQRNKSRRKTRVCRTPGCEKYVVDHGLCIAHGGGKRCSVEDCNCRAQNRGLCWKHGGFTICTVEGCERRAKSRGICWSHGGGTKCKTDGCDKIAVSHGRCWAHGGGKRCLVEGCKKPASERMNNCCTDHFDPYGRGGIISSRLGQLQDEH